MPPLEAAFLTSPGSRKARNQYTGAPHPVRDDRVLFLVESDRSWSQAFG